MNLLQLSPLEKQNGFRNFLLKRNPSESFAAKYMTYLTSRLVRSSAKNLWQFMFKEIYEYGVELGLIYINQ